MHWAFLGQAHPGQGKCKRLPAHTRPRGYNLSELARKFSHSVCLHPPRSQEGLSKPKLLTGTFVAFIRGKETLCMFKEVPSDCHYADSNITGFTQLRNGAVGAKVTCTSKAKLIYSVRKMTLSAPDHGCVSFNILKHEGLILNEPHPPLGPKDNPGLSTWAAAHSTNLRILSSYLSWPVLLI